MSQNSLLEKFNLNIIKWYPFENDKTLLQIGNNENLEKYLKNILKDVKSTKIIQDAEQFNMLFDYILIYGYEGQDDIMENAKKYLNKNGKVLIIGNNDLGINTWSKYDITRTSGILKLENNFKIKTIKNVLKELETNNYKIQNTFYIFPDYSKAEIIINKNFKVDGTKIDKYNPNIFENDIKVFNEKDVLKTIINNDSNMLETFANSYFIEATKSTDSYENIEEEKRNKEDSNSIKYVSFNNSRKEQYQLITIIKNDIVEKLPANINSKSHIENMSNIIEQINNDNINILDYFKDGKIYSKLIKDKLTLDEILFENSDNLDKVADILNNLRKMLLIHSLKYSECYDKIQYRTSERIMQKLNYMKHGYWDMIAKNCFCIDNQFVFFDQEWEEDYLPVEFILYRSIVNSYELVKKIKVDELLEKLNIFEYKNFFDEIDNKLRKKILDKETFDLMYKKDNLKAIDNLINENKSYILDIKNKEEYISNLENYYNSLKEDNEKKQEYITNLENALKKKR